MSINTTMSMGLLGIRNAMNRVDSASARIAGNMTLDTEKLAQDAVAQMEGAHHVKMSANVIKVADEMVGTLINIRV